MKELIYTLKIGTLAIMVAAFGYIIIEPAVSSAVEDQFTITQSVTGEISFLTPASDVSMSPALAGITGGTSNGSTYVRVLTNNISGYSMTLTASSSDGMVGNTQGGVIPAYVPASGITPDFTFTVPANSAAFGYTVEASTTADLASDFMDNGADTCGTGSSDTVDACWVNASTTARTIINRSTATAASGATTTIKFRVVINSNPTPAIPADTYVATTTLTAVTNP